MRKRHTREKAYLWGPVLRSPVSHAPAEQQQRARRGGEAGLPSPSGVGGRVPGLMPTLRPGKLLLIDRL